MNAKLAFGMLIAHLVGTYCGLALFLTVLPLNAIIGGAVFTTVNMLAYWFTLSHFGAIVNAGQPGRRE